jgi:predicted ATP-dependent protease
VSSPGLVGKASGHSESSGLKLLPGAVPSGPAAAVAQAGPLPASALATRCDPATLGFETTADLGDAGEEVLAFGQDRAVQALHLALAVPGAGYNPFVLGAPGVDRHALVRRLLQAHARTRPAPPDWCYVYNFVEPNRPRILSLPPGEGLRLREAMRRFVGELSKAVTAALDSEDYRSRLDAIQKDAKAHEEGALQALGDRAAAQGVALLRTPQGFAFAPMRGDAPMPAQDFEQIEPAERERLRHVIEDSGAQLQRLLHELPRLRREMQQRVRDATRDAMGQAAGHLVDELKSGFATQPKVVDFLDEVRRDIVEAGEQLRAQPGAGGDEDEPTSFSGDLLLHRYQVNLLVGRGADGDAAHDDHAPVRECEHPSYANLVGRIDHIAHLGTLLTNFTLIRPGALHRANGGVLMLDAVKVIAEPMAWAGLKRALKSARVVIESLPQALGWVNTLPLEPQAVPLDLKIVLFGQREHYYALQALDPEFDELFKIAADFEDDVARGPAQVRQLAQALAATSREQHLRPLDRCAVARVIDHAARLAEDGSRLSTHTRTLADLLHEADAQAAWAGHAVVTREDVAKAQAARLRRADRVRERLQDALMRQTLLVATDGQHVGQVNGLAVTQVGAFRFGHPVRLTATVRLGDGDLVDIERESTLGGPIHSKGVMILAACLAARHGRTAPMALSASLVFEQSYGPVEGDSATLAELCALLSALSGLPLRQALAVTGSINQFGRVQAVGGINEKIEGYFDLCRERGLDGSQGVIIPRANVQHLMLRDDVVEAAAQSRFHVWPVDDADEAIALLTGVPAGTPDTRGAVAEGTVHHHVAQTLQAMSRRRRAWGTADRPAGRDSAPTRRSGRACLR